MNCKPGDLAVVVRAPAGCTPLVGRIVQVSHRLGGVAEFNWVLTEPVWCQGLGQVVLAIADELLQPLRDAGDDARDETLDWLDVPQKVTA